MELETFAQNIEPGSDCRLNFKAAYNNRYTWEPDFPGYKGICSWTDSKNEEVIGSFVINRDLNVTVKDIDDSLINKSIKSQLWEVAIHRVRRDFEDIHGRNTFTVGDYNNVGMEVIVDGKNKGDRYRIKNDIVTMVYRHIHGKLINIFTQETINTGIGYLSKRYTSEYKDPSNGENIFGKSNFLDEFKQLTKNGPWVLIKRDINVMENNVDVSNRQVFRFRDLELINYSS